MNCVLHVDFNPPRSYICIFSEYVYAFYKRYFLLSFYKLHSEVVLLYTEQNTPSPLYLHRKWFIPSSPIWFPCPNYLYQHQYCTIYSYHFVFIKIISLFVSLPPKTGLPVANSRGYLTTTQLWKDVLCAPWKTSLLSYVPSREVKKFNKGSVVFREH